MRPGTVTHTEVMHDDWCAIYTPERTCNCNPTRVLRDADWRELARVEGAGFYDPLESAEALQACRMTNPRALLDREEIGLPGTEAGRMRVMWLYVLQEALVDPDRDATLYWLLSADGRMVCELAGVDPDFAAERFCNGGAIVGWARPREGRGVPGTRRGPVPEPRGRVRPREVVAMCCMGCGEGRAAHHGISGLEATVCRSAARSTSLW